MKFDIIYEAIMSSVSDEPKFEKVKDKAAYENEIKQRYNELKESGELNPHIESVGNMVKNLSQEDYEYYVLRQNGKIVAMIALTQEFTRSMKKLDDSLKYVWVNEVAALIAGNGYGSIILTKIFDLFSSKPIILQQDPSQPAGLGNVYAKCGMTEVKTIDSNNKPVSLWYLLNKSDKNKFIGKSLKDAMNYLSLKFVDKN